MPRIGIITGSGPQAGVDLWQKILLLNQSIIEETRIYEGDKDAPHVVIHSVPMIAGPHYISSLESGSPRYEAVVKALQDTIIRISKDCDVFCITCHTLHYLEGEIRCFMKKAEAEGHKLATFMSIVSTTKDKIYASRDTVKSVAIMGSKLSSDVEGKSAYRSLTEIPGVECRTSSDECRERQQNAINACKKNGPEDPCVLWNMSKVLNELGSHDALVLACTEFPLIVPYVSKSVRAWLMDPTEELARRLLTFTPEKPHIDEVIPNGVH